ncbi:MAG: hypothetical protein LBE22_04340 [Azoarcus sp.]|jgi:hypothetical protein|nr:hypothetical protein [Azoarcus sp.]
MKNFVPLLLFLLPVVAVGSEYDTLRLLARSAGLSVPTKNNHCEINEPGKKTTVGDFLAAFGAWSLQERKKTDFSSLECEALHCTLSFGAAKEIEGWGRILKFTLTKQGVDQSSLECIDVP